MTSTSQRVGQLHLLHSVAGAVLALAASQASAKDVTLCVEPYQQTLPVVGAVPMWGYRQVTAAADCAAAGTPASPGPAISVPASDTTLTIQLVNKLNVPTSVVLMGQALPIDGGGPVSAPDVVGPTCDPATAATVADKLACRVRSFTGETAPGATRTYTFANLKPGTYLYQSGTHPQVQVQMGLFGLVTHDATLGGSTGKLLFARADGGYDVDVPLVLSEIDPAQHARIAATLGSADPTTWKSNNNTTLNYAPQFFLINGKVFDAANLAAADLPVTAPAGSRIALRIANAGLTSRSLMLNEGTWKLVTEDGNPYPAPREQATALVPAAKTTDALLVSTAPLDGTTSKRVAIFDRRGGTDNGDGAALGGQVVRLAQAAPSAPYIAPIAAQVANEGSLFSLQVQSANVTGLTVTGPSGIGISPTGLITLPVPAGTAVPTAYSVTVADTGSSASQTFSVRVNHTPTLPATGSYAVAHGAITVPAVGALTGVLDPDGDTPLTAVQTVAASAGTLALNGDGSFTWSGTQPATGSTPVTFSVAARDPFGLQSGAKVVTLNVAANVAPVAGNDTYTAALARVPVLNTFFAINSTQQIAAMTKPLSTLTGNDSDADGTLAASTIASVGTIVRINPNSPAGCTTNCAVIAAPAGGLPASVTFNTATGTYTVVPYATAAILGIRLPVAGTYQFSYTIKDDQGATSNQAVVRVTYN